MLDAEPGATAQRLCSSVFCFSRLATTAWLTSIVGQNMTTSPQYPPHGMLTAALGGRRVYALIWGVWLFAAIIGHYVQEITRSDVIERSTKVAFATCVIGLVVTSALLLRGFISKKGREALLAKQPNLPPATAFFRTLVWIVPIMALGAALAPMLIK